jgi:hypothetical protein
MLRAVVLPARLLTVALLLQKYLKGRSTGVLMLEVAIAVVQIISMCLAITYVVEATYHAPPVEGGQNFRVYNHISSSLVRPLLPKKVSLETATEVWVGNATTGIAHGSDDATTSLSDDNTHGQTLVENTQECPYTITETLVPSWTLDDDSSGLEGLRNQQVRLAHHLMIVLRIHRAKCCSAAACACCLCMLPVHAASVCCLCMLSVCAADSSSTFEVCDGDHEHQLSYDQHKHSY